MSKVLSFKWAVGVLLLAIHSPLALRGQDLPYASASTGADGALTIPRPISYRFSHSSAYDDERGQVLVFGGYNGSSVINDTWVRITKSWTQLNPTNSPPARRFAAMAYDAERKRVLLFGGNNGSSRLADTWEWDGTNWTQRTPVASPSARDEHAMAYDALRKRVVLFGGYTGSAYSQETWEWDGTNWSLATPVAKPDARRAHAMAYHAARQRTVLFGGYNSGYYDDTWEWDGTTWVQIAFGTIPQYRRDHAMAYDAARQEIVLFGGYNGSFLTSTWTYGAAGWTQKQPLRNFGGWRYHSLAYDATEQKVVFLCSGDNFSSGNTGNLDGSVTEVWDGSNWQPESGVVLDFDMGTKSNGIWNFTTIDVPAGVYLRFTRNFSNTPVQWLATGAVNINGILNLDGESGRSNSSVDPGNEALGAPGGGDGGRGGRAFSVSGSYVGTAGGGPGGGAPGAQNQTGKGGQFAGSYGNTFLQPLLGGSGGGGGSSGTSSNGGNGGAGGGAILIASSADITLNGAIWARGGAGASGNFTGGSGSGGGIRLVADRIQGSGTILANGGGSTGGPGRVRLEAYQRPLATNVTTVVPSMSLPMADLGGLAGTSLKIASVAGANVRFPPEGNTANPDVIFTAAGSITVTVTGQNIPDGTPVRLRISSGTGLQDLPAQGDPAVLMTGNTASFSATVPAGVGTLQAYASISLAPPVP